MNDRQQWAFLRQALYTLKRQFGAEVVVIHLLDAETDYATGVQQIQVEKHHVRRAIVLPESINRVVDQGIDMMSANKFFGSQGGFDNGKIDVIFDCLDLPAGFRFSLDDHLDVGGEQFKVREIQEFEVDSGWLIKADRVDGAAMEDQA